MVFCGFPGAVAYWRASPKVHNAAKLRIIFLIVFFFPDFLFIPQFSSEKVFTFAAKREVYVKQARMYQ
jgi:hypothetical protein